MAELVRFFTELSCSDHYNFTLTNAYEIVLALELASSNHPRFQRGLHPLHFLCVLRSRASVDESPSYSHNSGVQLFPVAGLLYGHDGHGF